MHSNSLQRTTKVAILAATVLLVAVGLSFGQTVSLTAGSTSVTLPDGQIVPMWGYSCGTVSGATCAPLYPNAAGGWSPVVITVPYVSGGPSLQINLTNNLSFPVTLPTPVTGATNNVPTSLVIVGQLGGGLGSTGASCTDANSVKHGVTCTPAPLHDNQGSTWFEAN